MRFKLKKRVKPDKQLFANIYITLSTLSFSSRSLIGIDLDISNIYSTMKMKYISLSY